MTKKRLATIAAIQCGPSSTNKRKNIEARLGLVDLASKADPDYVLLHELATTHYFCGVVDQGYFDLAEKVPGPTTDLFSKKAREYSCNIILPIFEKGQVEGEYFNSAVVIGPNGEIVEGSLPDGTKVSCYRKVHIPSRYAPPYCHEKVYFRPGPGFPIFDTGSGRIGLLICFDRSFPEGWRVLTLQGAEMVFLPMAAHGWRGELYEMELRTMAFQNGVYVITANKCGPETAETERKYFGKSFVIGPDGQVIARSNDTGKSEIVTASIDLSRLSAARLKFTFLRDRKPEAYSIISRS